MKAVVSHPHLNKVEMRSMYVLQHCSNYRKRKVQDHPCLYYSFLIFILKLWHLCLYTLETLINICIVLLEKT